MNFQRSLYQRTIKNLGGITHHLVPQTELAEMAHPFYNQVARGGEGHLEVGKNVYYTVHRLCHMVLALKPFGCMPSSQSDGVQSAVINKFKDMIFLPIETSGESEVNAHSRVQMALGEAKVKAKTEFEQCLKSTGKSLDEMLAGVITHPLDITDAWKNSYSCSTNHKVWSAKFTARHPNLVALEVSSFKCGHAAPIYGVIEGIMEQSGTPYFCCKDRDENKPSGSIKIRVETIDLAAVSRIIRKRKAAEEIEAQLAALETELRGSIRSGLAQGEPEIQPMAAD